MRCFAVGAVIFWSLCGPAAWATEFNDRTPCSVLTRSLDAQNDMDANRSAEYLLATFNDLDRTRAPNGFPASDAGLAVMGRMARDTASLCAFRPQYSVRHAATVVYAATFR